MELPVTPMKLLSNVCVNVCMCVLGGAEIANNMTLCCLLVTHTFGHERGRSKVLGIQFMQEGSITMSDYITLPVIVLVYI